MTLTLLHAMTYGERHALRLELRPKRKNTPSRHRLHLPGCRNPVNSHVWTQDFRNQDRAIRLLIILHDSDPRAADGEPGTVQGVNEVTLAGALGLEANAGAAGWKCFAVRTGRDLAEFVARRQPNFDVVGFCRGEPHVAGAEQHGAIVQAEFLENCFRVAHEGFVLFVAFFRMRELEELDLLELMLAEDAARVFSRGAGLGSEAGRPRGDVDGEFFFGNGLVPVEIVEFDFGCGREPKVGVLDFEQISGEFRQLAGAGEWGRK